MSSETCCVASTMNDRHNEERECDRFDVECQQRSSTNNRKAIERRTCQGNGPGTDQTPPTTVAIPGGTTTARRIAGDRHVPSLGVGTTDTSHPAALPGVRAQCVPLANISPNRRPGPTTEPLARPRIVCPTPALDHRSTQGVTSATNGAERQPHRRP